MLSDASLSSGVRLGPIRLDAPFFQAGLAGYSDGAMRRIARAHGAPYCITEAMLDKFLADGGQGVRAAELEEADHPIAGQIMGSEPATMAAAARVLVRLGYDVVDVNLACPVKKIRRKRRGGHLLGAPEDAVAILEAVREAVDAEAAGGRGAVPLTVKLRRASDDSPVAQTNFETILERIMALGYAGTVIHGRTVAQKYIGPSAWPALARIVARYAPQAPPGFVFGGSGDIWEAPDIFRMIDETGVRLVSVARGCIGNPWIFRQARALAEGAADPLRPPTIAEQRAVLLEHFELSLALHGERRAGRMMRKFGIRFSRHHPEAERVKRGFIAVTCRADWEAVLRDHYGRDGPGAYALPAEATAEAGASC